MQGGIIIVFNRAGCPTDLQTDGKIRSKGVVDPVMKGEKPYYNPYFAVIDY